MIVTDVDGRERSCLTEGLWVASADLEAAPVSELTVLSLFCI